MRKEWKIEVLNPHVKKGGFLFALFDFDGTLSLIREGWQSVMKGYFTDELLATPGGADEDASSIKACVDDFVDYNTGKQTIYQCISLAEEIAKRGGRPLGPQDYKDEYHRRLLEVIGHRIEGLEQGKLDPRNYVVPGSYELLDALKARGVKIYIASGTDEVYAAHEAEILGVTPYIEGKVYGAQRDYKAFSKKMIVNRIINENNLKGEELIGFGDGYVEIENVKEAGGCAVGVATDEQNAGGGIDAWKRERLIRAHADLIIPDFYETDELMEFLF